MTIQAAIQALLENDQAAFKAAIEPLQHQINLSFHYTPKDGEPKIKHTLLTLAATNGRLECIRSIREHRFYNAKQHDQEIRARQLYHPLQAHKPSAHCYLEQIRNSAKPEELTKKQVIFALKYFHELAEHDNFLELASYYTIDYLNTIFSDDTTDTQTTNPRAAPSSSSARRKAQAPRTNAASATIPTPPSGQTITQAQYTEQTLQNIKNGTLVDAPEPRYFDVNSTHADGSTALTIAARRPNAKVAQLLLDANADPARVDTKGGSPFFHALSMCIKHTDSNNRTASSALAVAQALLRAKADPSQPLILNGRTHSTAIAALLQQCPTKGPTLLSRLKIQTAPAANAAPRTADQPPMNQGPSV